jgi:chorismate mutase
MELAEVRKEIDAIDEDLAKLFLKRMELSAKVAACKREKGLPVYDPRGRGKRGRSLP